MTPYRRSTTMTTTTTTPATPATPATGYGDRDCARGRRGRRRGTIDMIGTLRTLVAGLMCLVLVTHVAHALDDGDECELNDGNAGVCRTESDCEWAIRSLRKGTLSYPNIVRCGFSRTEPIICCSEENEVVPPSKRPATNRPPTSPAANQAKTTTMTTTTTTTTPTTTTTTTTRRPTATTTRRTPTTTTPIPTPKPTPFRRIPTAQVLTSAEVLDLNYELIATSPRSTFALPFLGAAKPTAPPLRLGQIQLRPFVWPTTSAPPAPPAPPIVWPTAATRPTPDFVTATTKQPTATTFWHQWSPHQSVTAGDDNNISHTHYDLTVHTTTTQRPPTTTTRPQLAITTAGPPHQPDILGDTWLLGVLEEARQTTTSRPPSDPNGNEVDVGVGVGVGVDGVSGSGAFVFPFSSVDAQPSDDRIDVVKTTTSTTRPPQPIPPTPTPTTTTTTTPKPLVGRSTQRPCDEACSRYTLLSGPSLDFHILGGAPTFLGEFPHMVALGTPSDELKSIYRFDCGGTIIAEQWILTAAHCLSRAVPTVVRIGKIFLESNEDEVEGLTVPIRQIVRHPNYQPSLNYDDIALIQLVQDVEFNSTIRPACLYTDMADLDPALSLIVTGWGNVGDGRQSSVLLKTNLTAVTLGSCNQSLTSYSKIPNRHFRSGLNLGHICAHDPGGKKDACQGDSGGPLQLVDSNDMATVVGVVSFGISCGSTFPSVYARVANYVDWIESVVWPTPAR